jgi:pyruvate kinase
MAMRLSDERPRAPVVAFTRERQTLRRLALYWGVEASLVESAPSPAELVAHAGRFVLSHAGGAPGDVVVVVLGSKLAPGSDYSVKLLTAGEPL